VTAQVQNNGLARITATLASLPFWIGWGTGSGATKAASDLASPAAETRTAAVAAQGTTNVANDSLVLVGTITATAARAITEFGAFDAVSGGAMDLYSDVAVINLSTGDSIVCTLRLGFV
jgi:hypothetical protein